jgi:hypothetical protein
MANSSKLLTRTRNVALALAVTAVLAACGGDGGGRRNPPGNNVVGNTFAVTTAGRLLNFDRTSGGVQSAMPITGLGTDVPIGFDVRPADNTLVVVAATGATGRIYTVDPASGVATLRSTISVPLTGASFGVDFNPVPDRIRLVSNMGQNLRIPVMTGVATVDGTLTNRNGPTAMGVTEVGYTTNFGNACRTQLFYLDTTNNRLLTTNAPNNGVVTVVGSFGVQTSAAASGFEIITDAMNMNTASVVLTVGGIPNVYSLNLTTGAVSGAMPVMGLNPAENIVGIAAMTPTAAITQAPGNVAAVTASNRIYTFDSGGQNKICTGPTAITGLDANTVVAGIDFRPSTNQLNLVGRVGTAGKLYVVDPVTGVAAANPVVIGATLTGTAFGVDFNPSNDQLRIVGNDGQNLSVNPGTGVIAAGQVAVAGAMLAGAGYTNSIGPLNPASTTLFTIDQMSGMLNIQNPAGSGVQTAQGSLTLPAGTVIREFDINGSTNMALLGTQTAGGAATTTFYTVDLTTGAATLPTLAGGGVLPTALNEAVTAFSIRPPQQTLFGVTTENNLVTFGTTTATAATFATSVPITGLQVGERLVGIDVRPVDNRLYALTDAGRVYVVNTATGALTATAPFGANGVLMPGEMAFQSALLLPGMPANVFGVDFNPSSDRLRSVVSDNRASLRSVIESGVTFVDTALTKMGPTLTPVSATSAAYSGSNPGTPAPTATTLYVIDTANDHLFVQNPPNDGILNPTTLPLGVAADATGGFDIVGRQTAFAALTVGASNGFYSVNLATGAATLVGLIGDGTGTVTGLAMTPSATDPTAPVNVTVTTVLNGVTLATFSSATPTAVTNVGAIGGLAMGETIRDIDFRPANGMLYGFTNQNRVLIINPADGTTTPAAAGGLVAGTPAASGGAFTTVMGTNFGIDFNPVPDRLRIVSDANQSLRIAVDAGATFQDRSLTTVAPATAVATAYTNSFAAPTPPQPTVLFQIDTNSGTLEVQDPPNMGILNQRGRLDPVLTFTKVAGFDIAGNDSGRGLVNAMPTTAAGAVALAVLQPTGATQSTLFRVNLAGNTVAPFALTPIGPIGPAAPAGTPTLITAFAIRLQ